MKEKWPNEPLGIEEVRDERWVVGGLLVGGGGGGGGGGGD